VTAGESRYAIPNDWERADERAATLGESCVDPAERHLGDLPVLGGEVAQFHLVAIEQQLDETRVELDDAARWLYCPAMAHASGRKPGEAS
jgi:hypothetical protein